MCRVVIRRSCPEPRIAYRDATKGRLSPLSPRELRPPMLYCCFFPAPRLDVVFSTYLNHHSTIDIILLRCLCIRRGGLGLIFANQAPRKTCAGARTRSSHVLTAHSLLKDFHLHICLIDKPLVLARELVYWWQYSQFSTIFGRRRRLYCSHFVHHLQSLV